MSTKRDSAKAMPPKKRRSERRARRGTHDHDTAPKRADDPRAVLSGVTQALRAEADGSSLPRTTVDAAARLMSADDASLLLPDGHEGLYVAHSSGPARKAEGLPVPLASSVAGRIVAAGVPTLLSGTLDRNPRFRDLPRSRRPTSSLIYPLYSAGILLGVLCLNRECGRRAFTNADLARGAVFASHVVLALEHARLLSAKAGTERLVAIGQLAGGIVHEINNPLAYIASNIEFVLSTLRSLKQQEPAAWSDPRTGGLLEAMIEALGDAEGGAARIKQITADVRILARAHLSQPCIFELADAVRSAARMGHLRLRSRVELDLELEPNLAVHGNPGQLAQALLDILALAAVAAGAESEHPLRIRVTTRRDERAVVVEVAHRGPSLPPKLAGRLFEPFGMPLDDSGTRSLASARETLERSGGHLQVRSLAGEETVFTLDLPPV